MTSRPSPTPGKKRYAIVGTGGRSRLYIDAILRDYSATSALAGFCDVNAARMTYQAADANEKFGCGDIPIYGVDEFEKMIAEQAVDTVIVTSVDRTHHEYLVRAFQAGCDAITEKPMTTDIAKCQSILEASKATGKKLKVTFNYRYSPSRTKIKELLMDGAIGDVTSVHFEWLLSTIHGADYFRRWHRDKRNSGGLMVHKATHHFDLVNWWLASSPEMVFGLGKLDFYGRANAEARGEPRPWYRATGNPLAKDDPFAIHLDDRGNLENLYLKPETDDGYLRDQNPFGDGISIEDTMNLVVRYKNRVQMTYSLTAYSPWEGFRIAFNGTKGRIELDEVENAYVNAGGDSEGEGATSHSRLTLFEHWGKPQDVSFAVGKGGHGGGDVNMLADIFGEPRPDRFGRAAGPIDGARSILTGIAANRSFETGLPVYVDELLKL